ncbi:E3 SUMO-protein ligase MMS21 [Pseudozyma hubeiensis]|nr:E3 SUMO-protein ligase MMS21 [Pseudozyma hubeiensis]
MPSATRRRRVDDSDEEFEEVAPSSQRRSQAVRSNSQAQAASSSAGPSSSRSAAAATAVDLDTELRPQPLSREHVPNVRSLVSELRSSDASILRCIELLNETAEQLAEAFRNQDSCTELEQADVDLRELIDAQAEKAIRRKVLEEIAQDLHTGTTLSSPADRYKQDVASNLDAYNKQTSRKKYAKNAAYENFKNTVWVAKEDGPMPLVKDLIPREDGDEEDSDDEIQTGGLVMNFRCPLTTNILEDPLTNSLCSHSYSKSAIEAYVAAGNNKCPASSCTANVSKRSLKQDPALVKKVAAFKRREEERLIARRQTSTVLY